MRRQCGVGVMQIECMETGGGRQAGRRCRRGDERYVCVCAQASVRGRWQAGRRRRNRMAGRRLAARR